MAISNDLPPELLHAIFVRIEDERPLTALVACSTISRHWREIALPHLFSTLQVRRKWSFADLLPFLSTHAHIAAHIKQLWLRTMNHELPSPQIDHDTMHMLLARLPALQKLSFEGVDFVNQGMNGSIVPPDPEYASTSPSLATMNFHPLRDNPGPYRLQHVLLDSCSAVNSVTPLFRILSLCEMDTLRVTHINFDEDEPPDRAALHRPLRMRRLIYGVPNRLTPPWPLLDALRGCIEPGCIRELEIGCDSWDSIKQTGTLLRDVGRNVTTLRLSLLWSLYFERVADTSPGQWTVLNLSECTPLRTFDLFLPFIFLMDLPGVSGGSACASIVRVLPPSVRTITLQLHGLSDHGGLERAYQLGLKDVEEALMGGRGGRFPELASVTLQYAECGADKLEAWTAFSRRVVPKLRNAGLLRVTCNR